MNSAAHPSILLYFVVGNGFAYLRNLMYTLHRRRESGPCDGSTPNERPQRRPTAFDGPVGSMFTAPGPARPRTARLRAHRLRPRAALPAEHLKCPPKSPRPPVPYRNPRIPTPGHRFHPPHPPSPPPIFHRRPGGPGPDRLSTKPARSATPRASSGDGPSSPTGGHRTVYSFFPDRALHHAGRQPRGAGGGDLPWTW